jgi:hypothetical protein
VRITQKDAADFDRARGTTSRSAWALRVLRAAAKAHSQPSVEIGGQEMTQAQFEAARYPLTEQGGADAAPTHRFRRGESVGQRWVQGNRQRRYACACGCGQVSDWTR